MKRGVSTDLIAELRACVNLVALVERTTELRQSGERFIGLCPFHDERTPSFHVVPDRGFFHCFGCGIHGDAFEFIMQSESVGFREAVNRLAQNVNIDTTVDTALQRSTRSTVHAIAETNGRTSSLAQRRTKAFRLWRDRLPLKGSIAETYLVEARGLDTCWVRQCPVLGFSPRLAYWATEENQPELIWEGPVLLAAMQDRSGSFAATHITYLQPDGSGKLVLCERPGIPRPAKKVRGRPSTAAIRLTPAAERMVIGEGIETTASVFGVIPHGWAAYSLDNLSGAGLANGPRISQGKRRSVPSEFPDMNRPGMLPPPECRHVTYLGDGDTKDQLMLRQKLKRAVRRAQHLGVRADYVITPRGTDFNDLLRKENR